LWYERECGLDLRCTGGEKQSIGNNGDGDEE
jgi:hypothetical protein